VIATDREPGLDVLLGELAVRIAEHGTASEPGALEVLAEATAGLAPGAAAALTDRTGSEVARLRAFGLLHGLVLHALDLDDRSWLLDRLTGASEHLSDRVA
jgi:hypothetical protein